MEAVLGLVRKHGGDGVEGRQLVALVHSNRDRKHLGNTVRLILGSGRVISLGE